MYIYKLSDVNLGVDAVQPCMHLSIHTLIILCPTPFACCQRMYFYLLLG